MDRCPQIQPQFFGTGSNQSLNTGRYRQAKQGLKALGEARPGVHLYGKDG